MSTSVPMRDLLSHDSAVREIYSLNIAFIAATAIIIGLRLAVQGFLTKRVAADDYLMVAAGLFSIAFSAANLFGGSRSLLFSMFGFEKADPGQGIRYGLGRHIWDLPPTLQLMDNTKKIIQVSKSTNS